MRRRRPAFSFRSRRRSCSRSWVPRAALTLALSGLFTDLAAGDAAGSDEQVRVHAEAGAEYDNNVHWAAQTGAANGPPRLGSPLGRLVLGISAADRVAATQDVAFSLLGATKLFWEEQARSENVAVVETSGTWRMAAGERTRLALHGAYYEAIQEGTAAERAFTGVARDFRSLSPTFRVARTLGASGSLALGGGYRWFAYKPLAAYDFQSPVLALEYRFTRETASGDAEWDAVASAGVELRRFAGTRLVREQSCSSSSCAAVSDPAGDRHIDQFFAGRAEVTRTGAILLGVGYGVQWNRSNSYSESLLRHAATVRFTLPLPLRFYLAARSELVFVSYSEHVAFRAGPSGQSFATIDDENRSQLRAELSRDVSTHLQVIARYSLYLNAIGQGTYQRQTTTLSLAATFD